METLKSEVVKIKDDIVKTKNEVEKYRVVLLYTLYSGGALLLLALWWIVFPPELTLWRLISHSCFALLLISFWVSYLIINKIKAVQRCLGGLRIKLKLLVWEKICDCPETCDCKAKIEKTIEEATHNWSDGIFDGGRT